MVIHDTFSPEKPDFRSIPCAPGTGLLNQPFFRPDHLCFEEGTFMTVQTIGGDTMTFSYLSMKNGSAPRTNTQSHDNGAHDEFTRSPAQH